MTRKEVSAIIFNYIKYIGFKPYNIQYGSGYFIFDKGKDGVVHFYIKGLYGWKFAMWINTNKDELKSGDDKKEYPALRFFVQHEDNIDKFKPSSSFFLVEYNLNEIENPAPYQWRQIKGILQMIKRHPFISYYHDQVSYFEFTGESFILNYIKSKLRDKIKVLKHLYNDWIPITWIRFKLLFCSKNRIIKEIKIIDKNHDGWVFNPRWNVDILFNENSTNELECDWLNRWFKYRDSNIDTSLHRVGIDGYYDYV